jgi:aldehyde reductase
LFHFPVSFKYKSDEEKWPETPEDLLDKDYMDVWSEMEKLVEKGLVKHIGVSNFNAQQIQRVFDCSRIKPACNEIEFHPGFARDELIKLCSELNVQVLGYCPLGRHKEEKKEPKFLYDERVVEIGRKYNKSPAQIALRFAIQSSVVPLPKSGSKNRIYENINVFDFQLSGEEMSFMKTFHDDKNQICKFHFAEKSVYYPY